MDTVSGAVCSDTHENDDQAVLRSMAGFLCRLSPEWMRPFVWLSLAGPAAERIVLLAHDLTAVVAGRTMGVLFNRAVGAAVAKQMFR
jgi:hypothetical protein